MLAACNKMHKQVGVQVYACQLQNLISSPKIHALEAGRPLEIAGVSSAVTTLRLSIDDEFSILFQIASPYSVTKILWSSYMMSKCAHF